MTSDSSAVLIKNDFIVKRAKAIEYTLDKLDDV